MTKTKKKTVALPISRFQPTVADRIQTVSYELTSIRAELAPPGSTPHAELHDIVKTAEKTFTLNDSLPTYLAELRG